MTFKTDGHGIAFKCNDIKITGDTHTWAMKISQLYRQTGIMRIITYSLPNIGYVKKQFERRPKDIFLIAHSSFQDKAEKIKEMFPDIRIALHKEVHSKVLLIEPNTIYISSANFGNSGWHEANIGLHSKEAHDWYLNHQFIPLWEVSTEVK